MPAKELAQAEQTLSTLCESYREKVKEYFGDYTQQALFVANKESGCQNKKSNKPNSNGTYDFCIFQINNEPSALKIDTCIKRAWEKFEKKKNWSQWYAVCTLKKVPKYKNIKCI